MQPLLEKQIKNAVCFEQMYTVYNATVCIAEASRSYPKFTLRSRIFSIVIRLMLMTKQPVRKNNQHGRWPFMVGKGQLIRKVISRPCVTQDGATNQICSFSHDFTTTAEHRKGKGRGKKGTGEGKKGKTSGKGIYDGRN